MHSSRKGCLACLCACAIVGLLVGAAPGKPKAKKPRRVQHKRLHIKPMKLLLSGEFDKADKSIQRALAAMPDSAESLYCLAILQANVKKPDAAVVTAIRAVEAGLPIGRFFAGPRRLTRALVKNPDFQVYAKLKHTGPVHGPMLGCVTDTSAKFWVRTSGETTVQVVVSTWAELADPVRSAQTRTRKDRDFTAVVAAAGLKADTVYYYDVLIGGESTMGPAPWKFRTHPAGGAKSRFDVAFGGGSGFVPPNERVWDTILKRAPRAFLALGDNVYIDTPLMPGIQQYCYYRRQSRPEYRRLVAATPVYAIWDDHDFGTNDCSGGPEISTPEWKAPVWRIFRDNWNNPYYAGGEKQPGCWFDFSIGDVDFFMTDGRYYRTEPRKTKEADRSMLGSVQKRWLLAKLKASKATFKVIASGTPWTLFAKGASQDTWNGFKKEREEIFSFIEANRIGGVVLISADRHRHDVWKIPRKTGYDFYEFESSRLTNQHVHGTMKDAEFSWNGHGFGLLTFDTTKPDPEATYRIVSIDDKIIHTFTVKKSQLTHR